MSTSASRKRKLSYQQADDDWTNEETDENGLDVAPNAWEDTDVTMTASPEPLHFSVPGSSHPLMPVSLHFSVSGPSHPLMPGSLGHNVISVCYPSNSQLYHTNQATVMDLDAKPVSRQQMKQGKDPKELTRKLLEAIRQNTSEVEKLLMHDKLIDWGFIETRRQRPRTILHYALSAQLNPKLLGRICKLLIKHKVGLNQPDWKGETGLMFAVKNNFGNAVTVLLENGAMFEQITEAGSVLTALAGTSQFSLKLANRLLADPRSSKILNGVDKNGVSPLSAALKACEPPVPKKPEYSYFAPATESTSDKEKVNPKNPRWTFVLECLKRNAVWPKQDAAADFTVVMSLLKFVGNDLAKFLTFREVLRSLPRHCLRAAFGYTKSPNQPDEDKAPTILSYAIKKCHSKVLQEVLAAGDGGWHVNSAEAMKAASADLRGKDLVRTLLEAGVDVSGFPTSFFTDVVMGEVIEFQERRTALVKNSGVLISDLIPLVMGHLSVVQT